MTTPGSGRDRERDYDPVGAATPPRVSAVAGPASRDTTATDGAKGRGIGGTDSDREGGRLRVRFFLRSWRRRDDGRDVAAGDAERERIERDLHDGVQQRLTALRIGLNLAAERFGERGDTEASAVLQGFGDDVDHVIDEVRDLARGIYPALLSSAGLARALLSAGSHAGRAVTVHASGVRRCRPDVERAVYFSCLAALDNAAKHAGPGPVSVCLSDTGSTLRFAVYDSGPGFDANETPTGTGIANMRARMAAVGGTLTIDSTPAHGTRVEGSVPEPWAFETP